jgi:hypothetical protein
VRLSLFLVKPSLLAGDTVYAQHKKPTASATSLVAPPQGQFPHVSRQLSPTMESRQNFAFKPFDKPAT